MSRQLPLTPTEAEKFKALAVGESMWIVRAGEQDDPMLDAHYPPAEFVQACAPCETCVGPERKIYANGVGVSCPACRIKLVGKCRRCRGAGFLVNDDGYRTLCSCGGGRCIVNLGWVYVVGQPLPILGCDNIAPDDTHSGDCLFTATLQGRVRVVQNSDYRNYESLTAALAHYGPPESLLGQWAIEVRKA